MNRPRIGFTSTPLIFSLPATTFPVYTAPKWSESIAIANSQSAESANWCLCCPGSCTTQIDCLLTGALLSTGLPTFQASRPPAFLPPAPGLLPTTCTAPPPYVEPTGPRASNSSLLALHVKRWHNFQEPKAKEEECQSWHPG